MLYVSMPYYVIFTLFFRQLLLCIIFNAFYSIGFRNIINNGTSFKYQSYLYVIALRQKTANFTCPIYLWRIIEKYINSKKLYSFISNFFNCKINLLQIS